MKFVEFAGKLLEENVRARVDFNRDRGDRRKKRGGIQLVSEIESLPPRPLIDCARCTRHQETQFPQSFGSP